MYQNMKNQKNIHFTYTPGRHIRTYHRRAEPFVVHERSVPVVLAGISAYGVRVRVNGSNIALLYNNGHHREIFVYMIIVVITRTALHLYYL